MFAACRPKPEPPGRSGCLRRRLPFLPAVCLAISASLAIAACTPGAKDGHQAQDAATSASWVIPALSDDPALLAPAEVQEYRGQLLTARAALPDNSIAGPQHFDPTQYRLEISGLVDRPLSLSYEEVLAFPAVDKVVTLHCVEGWTATMLWTGVLLAELLTRAGVQARASTLLFVCLDGYETTMELSWVYDKNIVLAWATNGLFLEDWNGAPFQLVAEDKWGYKWAKWVSQIRVLAEPDYRGFWESRGFAITGTLGETYSDDIEADSGADRR